VWLHASIVGEEPQALLESWAHLRLLLPTPAAALGLASALRAERPEERLDLDVTRVPPWVVISAGRNGRTY
jgi:hypothetical protein